MEESEVDFTRYDSGNYRNTLSVCSRYRYTASWTFFYAMASTLFFSVDKQQDGVIEDLTWIGVNYEL